MAKRVRIGVIGTGFARSVQIPAFLSHPDVEVTAIASGTPGKAKLIAAEFGIPNYFDDWRFVIDRTDVDLVCITTPPDLHCEMALFAANCGKHILCEKPMAMNSEEAEIMTAAAKDAGVIALIDHELRFQPGRQEAYQLLREGSIGKVLHMRYLFQAPHRGDPKINWNWWSDINRGGGALGAIGSHIIDSFCWLLETDVSDITCRLHTHIKQRPLPDGTFAPVTSDDESILHLSFPTSGISQEATALAYVSMIAGPEYINRLEIFGTEGSIKIEHRGELFLARRSDKDWQQINVPLAEPVEGAADTGFSRGFRAFVPAIVDSILNSGKPPEFAATFEDGLLVQRILDAARQSYIKRSAIAL